MALSAEDVAQITSIVQSVMVTMNPAMQRFIHQQPFQIPDEDERAALIEFARTEKFPANAFTDHKIHGEELLCMSKGNADEHRKPQLHVTRIDTVRMMMRELEVKRASKAQANATANTTSGQSGHVSQSTGQRQGNQQRAN